MICRAKDLGSSPSLIINIKHMGLNSQLMIDNQKRAKAMLEAMTIESKMDDVVESDLTTIKWIGEWTAEKLFNAWIKTIRQLNNKSFEDVEGLFENPLSALAVERYLKEHSKKKAKKEEEEAIEKKEEEK